MDTNEFLLKNLWNELYNVRYGEKKMNENLRFIEKLSYFKSWINNEENNYNKQEKTYQKMFMLQLNKLCYANLSFIGIIEILIY